jgi:prophage regulatory protein
MAINLCRLRVVLEARGISRSQHYLDIARGLFTEPVKDGRVSAWPDNEVDVLNRARVAGMSPDEIRQIVASLHAARKSAA